MKSVELFSGCGGLALGTARAGFQHARMVEWNEDACATLWFNKERGVEHAADWNVTQGDVRKIDWTTLKKVGLVAGGPPCQPFSIGGKHKGNCDDRDMWPEAIRAVREMQPRGFFFENVRGLARPAFAGYLDWIKESLSHPDVVRKEGESVQSHLIRLKAMDRKKAYSVVVLRVNAADFGAAQKRHRVIVAGVLNDAGLSLEPFTPTHSRDRLLWDKWVTGDYWKHHGIRKPLAMLTVDAAAVKKLRNEGFCPETQSWRTVRDAFNGLGEPNGKNNHSLQLGAKVYPGHTGCVLDEPAKALKAGDHGVPGGENMVVLDDGSVRYFSVREAARLQGLPDEWGFEGSWTENMRQLGNAVPTQLAEAAGTWMMSILKPAKSPKLTKPARTMKKAA